VYDAMATHSAVAKQKEDKKEKKDQKPVPAS